MVPAAGSRRSLNLSPLIFPTPHPSLQARREPSGHRPRKASSGRAEQGACMYVKIFKESGGRDRD